jgi:signal transduction histidine kinase
LGLHKDSSHTCNDIAETYLDMNRLSEAKTYALKAIALANGFDLQQERYAYYVLYLIDEKAQNYPSALSNYKTYQILEDSIFSLKKTNKINDLRIKYESEKQGLKIATQESNIALLDAKNSVKNQWLIFGSLGLLSIFLLFTISKSKNTAKKEKKQQEKFSQDLMQSQEKERTRIAKELHDSVGQKLTLIKRKSQNTDQLELANLTNNALEEVRSISRGLYPALLKELGLSRSIIQLVDEYDEQTKLFFTVDIDPIDLYFKESASLNFYRLIQECLTNIVKHAKAKSVTVSIKKEKESIITLIADNGKGFNLEDSKKQNTLGLKTIFERIKILEGQLSIDSQLNTGTNFILTIPLKNES